MKTTLYEENYSNNCGYKKNAEAEDCGATPTVHVFWDTPGETDVTKLENSLCCHAHFMMLNVGDIRLMHAFTIYCPKPVHAITVLEEKNIDGFQISYCEEPLDDSGSNQVHLEDAGSD